MRPCLALVVVAVSVTACRADRMADHSPAVRACLADITVIGTVTEIEKELVEAKPYPGATDPVGYTVAVVKIETNINGAKAMTHIKVGFIPPTGKQRYPTPDLKPDMALLLFLDKHPDGKFYLMPSLSPPVNVTPDAKPLVEQVKKLAPAFADPTAALKAEKAEDRALAAGVLVTKYRYGRFNVPREQVKLPEGESKLLLDALAGGDWSQTGDFTPMTAVMMLGLTPKDGFTVPQPKAGEDAKALWKAEFARWRKAEGEKYEVLKWVPKAK